jgi:hypothetical protein
MHWVLLLVFLGGAGVSPGVDGSLNFATQEICLKTATNLQAAKVGSSRMFCVNQDTGEVVAAVKAK